VKRIVLITVDTFRADTVREDLTAELSEPLPLGMGHHSENPHKNLGMILRTPWS
jgi:hypothetical protein